MWTRFIYLLCVATLRLMVPVIRCLENGARSARCSFQGSLLLRAAARSLSDTAAAQRRTSTLSVVCSGPGQENPFGSAERGLRVSCTRTRAPAVSAIGWVYPETSGGCATAPG